MSTYEEVMLSRGLTPSADMKSRWDASGCTYNPTEEGLSSQDCGQVARWHFKLRSSEHLNAITVAACDEHHGIIACNYGEATMDFHEWGSSCNLEGSWWIEPQGTGSFCATEERAVELGYVTYVEAPTDRVTGD